MDQGTPRSGSSTPSRAEHLCVLVHGLWGNPQHLNYISQSLRERFSEDELIILGCKSNSSTFTYDGVEIGGERVAREIEQTLDDLGRDGHKIKKFSIVGYSLGGLIARYAIGLLDHKGYFDSITPVNFTTFAAPHLGVRTPLTAYSNHLWNVLGARTLSESGRQLFTVDNFRDTGRPLLSVLADSDSIFIRALARFENRVLYTNIVNDRTAVYYTTGISSVDPYANLGRIKLNYLKGYEPIILDPEAPCEPLSDEVLPTFYQRIQGTGSTFLSKAPLYLAWTILLPIGVTAFLISSVIQNFRSRQRIMLHEKDEDGQGFGIYRIPYMVQEVRAGIDNAFDMVNAVPEQEYLPHGSEAPINSRPGRRFSDQQKSTQSGSRSEKDKSDAATDVAPQAKDWTSAFPTLALTPEQFSMIKALDDVGFKKFPVHIHKSSHSHAAMIVRHQRGAFDEGKIVIDHWLSNEFRI